MGTEIFQFMRNLTRNCMVLNSHSKRRLIPFFSNRTYEIVHGHSGHIDYLLASVLVSRHYKSHLVYNLYCPLNLDSSVTRYPFRRKYLESISGNVTFIAISKNIAQSLSQLVSIMR